MVLRLHAGKPALDALIVGAGQSGLVTAFALMRERVRNILAIDRAPAGKEGPWVTFARMPTLRGPKDQTGPDLGIPSLTFQAWYEAQHGAAAFASLHLIPSVDWRSICSPAAGRPACSRSVGSPSRASCATWATCPISGAGASWPTPERPRRLSRRHLCPRHGLPRRLYHARRAALDRRAPGEAPWLADIHVFGIGSTLSFGPSGSSINAMNVAVPRLVAGLTRGLFAGDLERRWQSLLDYEVKVVELDWSRIKTE